MNLFVNNSVLKACVEIKKYLRSCTILTAIGAETIVCIIRGVNYILVPLFCMTLDKIAWVLNKYKLHEPKADLKP